MAGRAALAIAGSLLLASACSTPFDDIAGSPLEPISGNYLSLVSGIPGLLSATASAVVVADGVAVTNAHVVRAADRYQAYGRDGGAHGVEVLGVSPRMDLAVLRVSRGPDGPLPIATAEAGERVWAMGTTRFPASAVAAGHVVNPRAWSCLEGTVPAADLAPDRAPDVAGNPRCGRAATNGLMFAAPGAPGYSGGPLVNENGEWVGLVQGIFVEVWDDAGRPVTPSETIMYAYAAADVLAEVERLLGRPLARPDHVAQSVD